MTARLKGDRICPYGLGECLGPTRQEALLRRSARLRVLSKRTIAHQGARIADRMKVEIEVRAGKRRRERRAVPLSRSSALPSLSHRRLS